MTRPLMLWTAHELEKSIKHSQNDPAQLSLILAELLHRKTQKARSLKNLAEGYLSQCLQKTTTDGKTNSQELPIMTTRHAAAASAETISQTSTAVAKQRAKLIDLSRRSPLINFRHSGRSATMLRIVDERPDLIFETICEGGMRFEPLPDPEDTPRDEETDEFQIAYESARLTDEDYQKAIDAIDDAEGEVAALQAVEQALRAKVRKQLGLPELTYGKTIDLVSLARANGFDPSYDLGSSDEDCEDHHEDDLLRVLLPEKDLQKRLKSIWDRYRLHYRETGIHTLYLAIGFVEWTEEDRDGKNHSPILLLGVEIERKIVRSRYEYTLRLHDEGLQVNIALAEKMREHWGLEMPALREAEQPESYFIRLRMVLDQGRHLTLRQFVTLAVLPFPQMVLWKDLDPDRWPKDAFGNHRLLPAVMGVTAMTGEPSAREPYDIDANEWVEAAPALVRPADASQHSALIEAAEGADLAIEGPPGTGKSETITNMIANAVANGKKVLFVAEKQAALQVVGNRLKASGLSPLTLELHGENAKRSDVYTHLNERLRARANTDPKHLSLQRERLHEKRTLLRNYLAQLEKPVGDLSCSAYDLVWREIHLRSRLPQQLQNELNELITMDDAHLVNKAELLATRSRLDVFGKAVGAIRDDPKTLWIFAKALPVFGQQDQLRAAASAADAAAGISDATSRLSKCAAIQLPTVLEDCGPALEQMGALEGFGRVEEQIVSTALRDPNTARSMLHLAARWRRLLDKIEQDISNVENCDRFRVTQLAEVLANIDKVPETIAASRSDLVKTTKLAAQLDEVIPSFERLCTLIDLPVTTKLSSCKILCGGLLNLTEQSASIRALMALNLLDPLNELVILEQESAAEAIRLEREELLKSVDADGIAAEPEELRSLADTLEHSGLFARLFSKEYKAAHRRTAKLLRDTSQRLESANLLRQTAKLSTSAAKFRDQSNVRNLFPKILWKGVDSDFQDLNIAREIMATVKSQFASNGLEQVLTIWLRLEPDMRTQAGELASAIGPVVESLIEREGSFPGFDDAAAGVRKQLTQLNVLDKAITAVGAKPEGLIVRDGETLPARIEALDSCKTEFDCLRQKDGFRFVGEINETLEPIARAMERVDILSGQEDTLSIMPVLRHSDAPVDLLNNIIDMSKDYCLRFETWQNARDNLEASCGMRAADLSHRDCLDAAKSWQQLTLDLVTLSQDTSGASETADLLKYQSKLAETGMVELAEKAAAGDIPAECLPDAYELRLVSHLLQEFLSGDGLDLQKAGGLNLADARKQFARIDKELHTLEAQSILAERLKDTVPTGIGYGKRADYTELSLLENELSLKRPRTPLRDVIHRAGGAMQALKPIWMMSPTSAAQYIRPGSMQFDLLIVDEASQMRPEFALSAMLRADQFVVVGDANQLPPSDHFGTKTSEEEQDDYIGIDADAESILDVANQKFRRKRRLKWHYRSRHESLIKFSNREFYEDDLIVFPSPTGADDDLLGAKLRFVPEMIPNTFYEASINQKEAEAILEEAVRLMIEYPQYSLGIAAMNAKQTTLIEAEFDRLRLQHPAVDRYVQEYADSVDEFFIKNLENVQGDERDIILISTVYGPDKNGLVKQHFGLMNREVGWRRLNVLVTRAKMSVRVFTSLRPGDVKVTSGSSKGIKAFNAYLTYLSEAPAVDEESLGDAESDFEQVVAERLTAEGFVCVPQVGVNRFRIDIGVKHDECGAGFLAGIECDGAPFHSGYTVRDRDRIRQQVLEGLNWKIYRVWSVDWYADASREMRKLVTWLKPLKEKHTSRFGSSQRALDVEGAVVDKTSVDVKSEANTPLVEIPAVSGMQTVNDWPKDPLEPEGKAMRSLDKIDWYEAERGARYTVWLSDAFVGEVTVMPHHNRAPKMYGHEVSIALPEYEARRSATDETRKHNDLYAAVRWVAAQAVE